MEYGAPGLTGDWINGWLAAVGITVLVDGTRLGWSSDPLPVATFEFEGDADLASTIASSLSGLTDTDFQGCRLGRTASISDFQVAAGKARRSKDFSLAASLTDLVGDPRDQTAASAFYVSGPGTVGTLWHRFHRCRQLIKAPVAQSVANSLAGRASRVEAFGLGFDFRRIAVGDMRDEFGEVYVDPVVECLAFYGLSLFPVRGNGGKVARTRGWRRADGHRETLAWPVWSNRLDRWAIDAVCGLALQESDPANWPQLVGLDIQRAFETVAYAHKGGGDPTRGFASRRVL